METYNHFYRVYMKRALDIVLSLLALIVLSPFLLVMMLLIKVKIGSPVLFKQQRAGRYGKPFTLYKFRTMKDVYDEHGRLLPDEQRLLKFGNFLRATSLDELPEIVNILKGDMSIIGPRPLLLRYESLYNDHQRRRHEVRPGLTGLAQVHGRNAISWEQKFNWDVEYVDHISFVQDVKIFFLTIKKVLCREGINNREGHAVEEFHGNKDKEEKK